MSKDRITIGGREFVAAAVPEAKFSGHPRRTSLPHDALAAMDELGVDSVLVAERKGAGTQSNWTRFARREGVPVRFVQRKRTDGTYDVYAIRTSSEVSS